MRSPMKAVFCDDNEKELVGSYLPTLGTFVEVGAYDPFRLSQTWHLEQRGWNGVLIEPIPSHAERLRANRTARVFEVACGPPDKHGMTVPIHTDGALSSVKFKGTANGTINVKVATLDSVLFDAGVSRIDFISVDVEGFELDVLKGFSFNRFRPKLMLLEDFGQSLALHKFMTSQHYKRVRRTGENSWYIPTKDEFPISIFGRIQLFRKYYLSLPVRKLKKAINGGPPQLRV